MFKPIRHIQYGAVQFGINKALIICSSSQYWLLNGSYVTHKWKTLLLLRYIFVCQLSK